MGYGPNETQSTHQIILFLMMFLVTLHMAAQRGILKSFFFISLVLISCLVSKSGVKLQKSHWMYGWELRDMTPLPRHYEPGSLAVTVMTSTRCETF